MQLDYLSDGLSVLGDDSLDLVPKGLVHDSLMLSWIGIAFVRDLAAIDTILEHEIEGAAIASKDLNGVITSWKRGAELLFGYMAEEIIGKSVTILIPEDHLDEEPAILARICRGERVDQYDTVRRRKDGSLIDISLTVSPLRGIDGRVIGASKIVRDITERKRAHEQQKLLVNEMKHRIKNILHSLA